MNRASKLTRYFFLFLILIGASGFLLPAQSLSDDVIYLRNGEVVRGQIVAQAVGESVTLIHLGGSRIIVAQSDILRITREPTRYTSISIIPRGRKKSTLAVQVVPRGFRWGIDVHFLAHRTGFSNRLDPGMSLRAGYRFSPPLELGLSAHMMGYQPGILFPLFLYARGQINKKRISPAWMVEAGHALAGVPVNNWWRESNEFSGQWGGQVAVGLTQQSRKSRQFSLMLGFRLQQSRHAFEGWGDPFGNSISIRRELLHRGLYLQGGFSW
jgi:hypothetical protein